MANNRNKKISSIRTRYFTVTLILGILFTSLSFYIYNNINNKNQAIRNTLETISNQRLIVDDITASLADLYRSIDSFLLDPTQDEIIGQINKYLDQATKLSHRLNENDHIHDHDTSNHTETKKIIAHIQSMPPQVYELISLRKDISKQYPGFYYSATVMSVQQNKLRSGIELLVEEAESQKTIKNPSVYPELLKTHILLEKLVSQNRIYMANRLASFTTDILQSQALSLHDIHQTLMKQLHLLLALYGNETESFEGTDAIEAILHSEQEWYRSFEHTRKILESDDWRRDTYYKQIHIIPLFTLTSGLLASYKLELTAEERSISRLFEENNQILFFTLVGVISISLIYIMALLLAMDLLVFKPIANVAKAMKMRAFGHNYPQLKHIESLETKNLTDAFNEMDFQIQKRQSALEYQALHDSLTSLPNRIMLDDRLQYQIAAAKKHGNDLTVFLLDLNHFKQVNDSLGHHIGDLLLIQVGQRLAKNISETDTLVRLGGDEFAILFPELSKADSIVTAEKIFEEISHSFMINDHSIHITTSIGIVSYPDDATDHNTLLQLADIAMYNSKQNKTKYTLYDAKMNNQIVNRVTLLTDLHEALETDKLEMYYQPQINLRNNQVSACEALIRWRHPEHGFILPEEIISLAEQFGIMNRLTHWILDSSIQQCAGWHNSGYETGISVNLSTQSLNDNKLCDIVEETLKKHNLESRFLTLEITENSMMSNPGRAIEVLKRLNKMGVYLSIDDFGTGFSSLSYLKELPVQEVKIDKSFVFDMENNKSDEMIVQSTIDLGHNLGLYVIAEGIESLKISEKLRDMGCDYGQGFWILKPVNADEIIKWFSHNQQWLNARKTLDDSSKVFKNQHSS